MEMNDSDIIQKKFDTIIEELKKILPTKYEGSDFSHLNCAALTMRALLDILQIGNPNVVQNIINMASCTASITGICGAANAGLMGVGLIVGGNGKIELSREKAAAEGLKFYLRFKKTFGSSDCTELTGTDLRTIEGMNKYVRDGI